tara:strand:+ start:267 stop:971 length:705 start_codon:yes stop_codon:yes gene_type:complete
MPDAVIFDLDGTLLDTRADITAALNAALVEHGFPAATDDEVETRVGWGLSRLVEQSLPAEHADDRELIARVAESTRRAYRARPVGETVPYPGIVELLEDLAAAGVPMAVLSNKPDDLVQPIVAQLLDPVVRNASPGGLGFAVILGQRDGEPRKPDPTTTLRTIERLGTDPAATVFVGDSEVDVETALSAGCVPVGVAWGYRDAAAIRTAGARHLCYSIEELRHALGLQTKEESA